MSKTQKRIEERLARGESFTAKKYGRDHVLAAGKLEVSAAYKMRLVYVLDVPGCGVIFRKP